MKIVTLKILLITALSIISNSSLAHDDDDYEEQKNCVIQEYRELSNHRFAAITTIHGKWSDIKSTCDLTYTEVKRYQDSFGMNLEKLRDY